jgi:hypothetical protein
VNGADHLDDTIDELLVLWPALPAALPRDAGTSSGERVTQSENVHSIPLNPDVATVITDLQREIPHWAAWAAETAGEAPNPSRDIPTHLAHLRRLHDRLNGSGRTRDAARLHDTAQRWRTDARRALGLNEPDRPIGTDHYCPRHDEPLTPLVMPGRHGNLCYARIDPAGRPVDATVEWSRLEVVLCRHCDAKWTPERYMLLGRLIRQANRDRAARVEAGDAA